jgi:hypothetical protein
MYACSESDIKMKTRSAIIVAISQSMIVRMGCAVNDYAKLGSRLAAQLIGCALVQLMLDHPLQDLRSPTASSDGHQSMVAVSDTSTFSA